MVCPQGQRLKGEDRIMHPSSSQRSFILSSTDSRERVGGNIEDAMKIKKGKEMKEKKDDWIWTVEIGGWGLDADNRRSGGRVCISQLDSRHLRSHLQAQHCRWSGSQLA